MEKIVLLGQVMTIIIVGWVVIALGNSAEDSKTEHNSKLNTEYVIGKDTLIITDYSTINRCYYLSNGARVDMSLVK